MLPELCVHTYVSYSWFKKKQSEEERAESFIEILVL